jgi:hypothetical protein
MPVERVILCGSVRETQLPIPDDSPLRLRKAGPHRNVRLTIEDLRQAMWRDVPSTFHDLIDIAVYVYVADQAISREADCVKDLQSDWRRKLYFRVPVRNVDFWSRPSVCEKLVSTLSFLSEDEYYFEFDQLRQEEPFTRQFSFSTEPDAATVDEVVMFSGGLDSLGGAVQEAVLDKRPILLVNHKPTQKLISRYRQLLKTLQDQARPWSPLQVAVRINKKGNLNNEYTQRCRSFLYASLGATIAVMLGRSRLRFYENGVVSLNLPPSAQVVGARATRTTHPRVLEGFSSLFSCLAGKSFTVENPFLWKTKTEVVKLISDAGCSGLIRYTTSCTRTWQITRQQPHCGICSQCIDRRFAVLAAGQKAAEAPESYKVDLFTGERTEGDPRTMLAAYVETCSEITKLNAMQFFARYGETSRVLRHIPGNAEATAIRIFDLHRRHAQEVIAVVDQAVASHASAIRNRELPPSCLVRLVCDASAAAGLDSSAVPTGDDLNAPSAPLSDYVFRLKGRAWVVRFAGHRDFILLPNRGAAYLHLLLAQPRIPISVAELAYRVVLNPRCHALGDAGPILDGEALTVYRVRKADLEADLERAKANNDVGWQVRTEQELEALMEELRRATGLGGRLKKAADDRERVRKAVGVAIRRAIRDIAKYDSSFAAHLGPPHLKCGLHPCYTPDRDLPWEL